MSGGNQTGAVGGPLSGQLIVRASDGDGPLEGVSITTSAESPGGGTTTPRTLTTGPNGEASAVWTLGSKLGTQTLTLTTTGVTPITVTASATPGPASIVFPVSAGFQFTVVSRTVASAPRVQVTDIFGNNIAGVLVTFEPGQNGGTVTGGSVTTGPDGTAEVGSWTVGPNPETYILNARIPGGALAIFQAQGIPATLTIAGGTGQTANAGTAVGTPPSVRAGRDDGSPLPGVLVSFTVSSGGGSIQGSPVVTNSNGMATLTRWVLGATPGANVVQAQAFGKEPLQFTATGISGAAANVIAASPTAQTGFFGNFTGSAPAVTVTDGGGNPVAGVPVTFSLTQGDGQIAGTVRTTDFLGQARLGSWRLGSATAHAVQANTPGAPPVDFTATAGPPPASTFTIDVRFVTAPPNQAPTPSQQAAFDQAAARWKEVILAGGAPYFVFENAPFCQINAPLNETVPGVVIFARLTAIDGVGGVLGQAQPCILRDDPPHHTAVGVMLFDVLDLATIESTNRLNAVILHEMGHVLGFGTLWNFLSNALLTGAGTSDPFFNGSSARGAFLAAAAPPTIFTGNPVPVENSGGPGTRDSHWREAILTNELMTGFISAPGVPNPLSAFTAASMRDMGYVVNDAVADVFTFQAAIMAAGAGPTLQLREAPMAGPLVVINRQGRAVRRVPVF